MISAICPSMAQSYYIEDDIYYTPGDKNPVIEEARLEKEVITITATPTNTTEASQSNYSQERDVDEYNRRYGYASYEAPVAEEGVQIDNTFVYSSPDVAPGDTLYVQMEDGYYLNGFNGSQSDYEYTVQIHRFYNPRYAVSISDPAYSTIYMLDSNDWNVYIDGSYAWVTPTWTNPWYWNYSWSPYSYSSWAWRSWGYGYGYYGWYSPWYDPWYDPWYYPGYHHYGWYDPWYYPGYHHHHHYPGYHPPHHHGYDYGYNYNHHGRGPGDYGHDRPGYQAGNRRPDSNDNNRYGGTFDATSKTDNRRGAASTRGNRVVVNGDNITKEIPNDINARPTNSRNSSRNADINTGTRGTTTNNRTTINNNSSRGSNNNVSPSRSSSNSRGNNSSVNSSRSSSSSNRSSSNVGASSSSSSSRRNSSSMGSSHSSSSSRNSGGNTGGSRGSGSRGGGSNRR